MTHIRRWLGSLLAPAEDPRRDAAASTRELVVDELLAELRRSRSELAQLRTHIETRAPCGRIAQELAEEEHELQEAEESLLLAQDEQRARVALLQAADTRLRAEF